MSVENRIPFDTSGNKLMKSKLLFVEGDDDVYFFHNLFKKIEINNIQIIDYKGKTNLGAIIKTLPKRPDYQTIEKIGITRDADDSSVSAVFKNINQQLHSSGFANPKELMEFSKNSPKTGIYIFPNCKDKGALEDLCLEVLEEDPLMDCVQSFMKCSKQHILPKNVSKAKLGAWLSSQNLSRPLIGQAICENRFDLQHTALKKVIKFIKDLDND